MHAVFLATCISRALLSLDVWTTACKLATIRCFCLMRPFSGGKHIQEFWQTLCSLTDHLYPDQERTRHQIFCGSLLVLEGSYSMALDCAQKAAPSPHPTLAVTVAVAVQKESSSPRSSQWWTVTPRCLQDPQILDSEL